MSIHDLSNQVQAIAILLKEMFPGSRIAARICGDGHEIVDGEFRSTNVKIYFWQWAEDGELFSVWPGEKTTREDLKRLVSADRVRIYEEDLLPQKLRPSKPKEKPRHWWMHQRSIPGMLDGYPMSKLHNEYKCAGCGKTFMSHFPEWLKPPDGECSEKKSPKLSTVVVPKQQGSIADEKKRILALQRQLTRWDYLYYVLSRSEVTDPEYDMKDKEFHNLLEKYPDFELPHQITRSLERASEYPAWVRKELGKPSPKGAFF